MTYVYIINKNGTMFPEMTMSLAEILPEREELLSVKNSSARFDTLMGRILLRYAVIREYGIVPQNTDIERNKFGKPRFCKEDNPYFSISHTKSCVACAVCDDADVGIDVETLSPGVDRQRIADRMFTDGERAYIYETETGRDERFCRIWTMKESYSKLMGLGLALPFSSFDVLDCKALSPAKFYPFQNSDKTPGCVCTAASGGVSFTECTVSDLVQTLDKYR